MPDLDFLPSWYTLLRRRRRELAVELAIVLAFLAGMIGWVRWAHLRATTYVAELSRVEQQQVEADRQLQLLADRRQTLDKLERQLQALAQLGPYLSTGRLVNALETAAPPSMSLTDLSVSQPSRSAGTASNPFDRQVRVTVSGVAPSDEDVATFIKNLSDLPSFQHVAVSYARDRNDGGRLLREFEIHWSVDLTAGAAASGSNATQPTR
jgi:Tfp pilus assembly protein PilN